MGILSPNRLYSKDNQDILTTFVQEIRKQFPSAILSENKLILDWTGFMIFKNKIQMYSQKS